MLLSAYFTGIHRIDVDYAGEPVPGSPFFAKSYDSSRVVVRGICDGVVGRRCSFTGEYTFVPFAFCQNMRCSVCRVSTSFMPTLFLNSVK